MEKRFYVNKYPISLCVQINNKFENLPAGTVFTIKAINGDFFELEPVSNIEGFTGVSFSVAMIDKGFFNTQYVDEQTGNDENE